MLLQLLLQFDRTFLGKWSANLEGEFVSQFSVNCCQAFCVIANYTSAEERRKTVCYALFFFLFAC